MVVAKITAGPAGGEPRSERVSSGWTGQVQSVPVVRLLFAYAAVCLLGVSGTAALLPVSKWQPATAVAAVGQTYILSQVQFVLTHVMFHALFIEVPEHEMSAGALIAYRHHYHDASVFPRHWLLYRSTYFTYPGINAVGNMSIGALFLAIFGLDNTAKALVGFGLLLGINNVQAITHEWYHVSKLQRSRHFWPPVRWLMGTLETIGVIDTVAHRKHHAHDTHSLDAVENFFDLWVPGWVEDGANRYFRWLLRLREAAKTQRPMVDQASCIWYGGNFTAMLVHISVMRAYL
jgi:hypothetical protein